MCQSISIVFNVHLTILTIELFEVIDSVFFFVLNRIFGNIAIWKKFNFLQFCKLAFIFPHETNVYHFEQRKVFTKKRKNGLEKLCLN